MSYISCWVLVILVFTFYHFSMLHSLPLITRLLLRQPLAGPAWARRWLLAALAIVLTVVSASAQTAVFGSTTVPVVAPATSTYFKGPIYRSSSGSVFNYSRFAYVYTASELSAAGIVAGATITDLGWLKSDAGTVTGNNTFEVRMGNTALAAIADNTTWGTLKTGTTVTYSSTTQAVTGAAGTYFAVNNTTGFVYTGGNLLILTDWVKQGTASAAINFVANPATNLGAGTASSAALTDASPLTTSSSSSSFGSARPTLRLTYTAPPPCTTPPTAGTAVASPANGCGTVSSNLSLTGSATGSGLTYQWQQSSTGAAGSFSNIAGATSSTYSATGLTADTYFQAIVTCSGQSATSSVAVVRVYSATAATYAALPVVENFESWVSRCGNQEVPSLNWIATPVTGDNSWRRNDQGFSTAGWRYVNNEPAPYPVTASQGTYSARFHSFGAVAGAVGTLDLYANLSAAGTKTLSFDYYNASGTDKLEVQLSTDGGATFSPTNLLTLGTSAAFSGQSVVIASTSATAVIRFKATSDFGNDDIGMDKLTLDLTPACAAVAFSPTTAITSNSATVNFGAASGGSTYTLTYSPGGSTPQTVTPGAVNLAGLQPYTLYNVTVTTNCGGGQTNTASTSFRTLIGNDECSGAVALTPGAPGAACSAQTYTTQNATNSTGVTSACAPPVGGDVWFSFVASGANHSITVVPTFDFDAVVDLRSSTGGCPGTSISCQNASPSGGAAGTETLAATGLTAGATYFVRVYSTFASTSYNFDICITTPANAPCAQVTNAAVTSASGTATASTGTLTFTAAAGATNYTLSLAPTAGGPANTGPVASSPVALNGLTPNTSYTLTITTNCSNGGVSSPVTVVFTSAPAPTPPANDDCAGAIALTPAATCTPTSGTTVGATASTAPGTCVGNADDDVWYSFVASATSQTITVVGATGFDAVVNLRSGACPGVLVGSCADNSGSGGTETIAATGLTVGATYLVRVFDYFTGTPGAFTICVTAPLQDLTVTNGQNVTAAGPYNNITVQNGGTLTFSGPTSVTGTLTVQSGGTLLTNCQTLSGAGSFVLAAGGTLGICDAAGILATGAAGAVQVTGTRTFSTDASYVYNGTTVQNTGTGLASQVRNLTSTNANAVTLSAPVQVTQVLTLGGAGNLVLNGQPLTLRSSAAGTALVVNSGTGTVVGAATVQRFINSSNTGLGYRHYSAPVANTTVADLATTGFTPEVSQATAYNASAAPGTTTPFPTVFGYDQSRVTLANTYTPFDRGFFVPASLSAPLVPGQGYAVNIAGTQLVDFVGTLNNGDQTVNLSRLAGNTDAGWALMGNPYPAPLDYSLVAPGDRSNLDAAVYVYESASQYSGSYRANVNGVGGNANSGSSLIASSQGFFVRVTNGQTSGTLTFRNTQRITDFATQVPFRRSSADTRPLVRLDLHGATGPADSFFAYAEAGATPNVDPAFDAVKLPNPTGLNLSSATAAGLNLAIDGRPAFTAATVLPLNVGVPAAGTYTLSAAVLNNLPAGLDAYLRDAQTGQTLNLRSQPAYAFTVTAGQATALLTGRFSLAFSATALATAPALTAAQVALYPNPARGTFTVLMPGVAGATAVQAELVNALGQVVRRQSAPLPASGATLAVPTAELAAGVYTLRLLAGPASLAKRVVIQ